MSKQNDTFRVRATTYNVGKPVGKEGYVMKLKATDVQSLIQELSASDYEANGATLFVNIFENESEFNKGETYLSTTISPIPTEEQQQSNKRGSSTMGNKISNSGYGSKVRGRRG